MKIISYSDINEDFFTVRELQKLEVVEQILEDIKNQGDAAVRFYTKKFDKVDIDDFKISNDKRVDAEKFISNDLKFAIDYAVENLTIFAKEQLANLKNFEIEVRDGVKLTQRIIPLESVGVYVPGGNFPLVSSLLMGVVPAKVAGVKNIIVCSPPEISKEILYAAYRLGIEDIFQIGGVQAIGAMAYGTQSIPSVNKIVGPGNKYVAYAKKQVYGICGIDFVAGPSEVFIIADSSANIKFIAADMIAQSEHDKEAEAILVTDDKKLAVEVSECIDQFLEEYKISDIARISIEKNGIIIVVDDLNDAVDIANRKAPEHLELHVRYPNKLQDKLYNYGSLFIGEYSAEILGDYSAGINHTLPTNGVAKFTGGLSVKDFVKIVTQITTDSNKFNVDLYKVASILAENEGLKGHKLAADLRLEYLLKRS